MGYMDKQYGIRHGAWKRYRDAVERPCISLSVQYRGLYDFLPE